MQRFETIVYINPLPKARARVPRKGKAYTPARTREYESFIKEAVAAEFKGDPWTGLVALTVLFYRKNAVWADTANLLKAVEDAIEGVVYMNDRQVAILHAERYVADPGTQPRVYILVEKL